jgi:hypothetical protein
LNRPGVAETDWGQLSSLIGRNTRFDLYMAAVDGAVLDLAFPPNELQPITAFVPLRQSLPGETSLDVYLNGGV